MWTLIIGIFLLYSATIFLLHFKSKHCEQKILLTNRVVMVTQNNQSQIEWHMRMLLFRSKLKGENLLILLIDKGSKDETIEIIEKIALKYELSIAYLSSNRVRMVTSKFMGVNRWNVVEINPNCQLTKTELDLSEQETGHAKKGE
jgi:hypothetical protein